MQFKQKKKKQTKIKYYKNQQQRILLAVQAQLLNSVVSVVVYLFRVEFFHCCVKSSVAVEAEVVKCTEQAQRNKCNNFMIKRKRREQKGNL